MSNQRSGSKSTRPQESFAEVPEKTSLQKRRFYPARFGVEEEDESLVESKNCLAAPSLQHARQPPGQGHTKTSPILDSPRQQGWAGVGYGQCSYLGASPFIPGGILAESRLQQPSSDAAGICSQRFGNIQGDFWPILDPSIFDTVFLSDQTLDIALLSNLEYPLEPSCTPQGAAASTVLSDSSLSDLPPNFTSSTFLPQLTANPARQQHTREEALSNEDRPAKLEPKGMAPTVMEVPQETQKLLNQGLGRRDRDSFQTAQFSQGSSKCGRDFVTKTEFFSPQKPTSQASIPVQSSSFKVNEGFGARSKSQVVPADVRGALIGCWVTLGEDLWGRGVTLGLERFVQGEVQGEREGSESSGDGASGPASPGNSLEASENACIRGGQTRGRAGSGWNCQLAEVTSYAERHPGRMTWNPGCAKGAEAHQNPGNGESLAGRLALAIRSIQPAQKRQKEEESESLENSSGGLAGKLSKALLDAKRDSSLNAFTPNIAGNAAPRRTNLLEVLRFPGSQGKLSGLMPLGRSAQRPALLTCEASITRPVPGSVEARVRMLLVKAAEAVGKNDLASYQMFATMLQPHAKKRGTGPQRAVHCLMHALSLRIEGSGPAHLRKRMRYTIQEMDEDKVWLYTGLPFCPFGIITAVGSLLPKLLGHRRVHIVNFGEGMVPQLPGMLKLLTQNQEGSTKLEKFRVTHVRAFPLARPGRTEFETMQAPEFIASVLHHAAEASGVEFGFHGIVLKETSLNLLEDIVREPGEALVATSSYEFKFFSEELGESGGAQQQLLSCIRRLQPAVVVLVEEEVEASGSQFVRRFSNWTDYMWALYRSHDAALDLNTAKHVYRFEEWYWNQICRSVVACEGEERRWRPKDSRERKQLMGAWGFQPQPVCASLVDAVHDMILSYPDGWGLFLEGQFLNLMWQGTKMASASSWCPVLHTTRNV